MSKPRLRGAARETLLKTIIIYGRVDSKSEAGQLLADALSRRSSLTYQESAEEHCSRREIDKAIGALIGMTHCSPEGAFDALADAVRHTGVGLGAVSGALLVLARDDASARANSDAIDYWQRTLDRSA